VTEATSDSQGPSDQPALSEEEYARIEAERDALKEELTRIKRPKRRRVRRIFVGLLVVISSVLILLSTTVVWAHRTVLNTDVFVSTVGPVFSEPGVPAAVATRTSGELFTQLHVEDRLKSALPDKVSFAAGPITNATKGFFTGELTKVLASSRFQTFWTNTLRTTHEQVVAVLHGKSTKVLSTSNGYITLNTVPAINQALSRISGFVSDLTGKHVTFPTITSAEAPPQAVAKLNKALGTNLPSNFGQITLVHSSSLNTVQHGVRAFDRLTILLPIITIILIALSLWISVSRRRTLIQLLVVALLLLIIERRIVIHAESTLAAKANNPQVAQDVLGQLLSGFFGLTAWILGIGLAILVVALVTGPYKWAVTSRSFVARTVRQLAQQLNAENRGRILAWMSAHANVLQLAGAVVAAIVFFIVSVSWLSFLIVGVLLVAFEFWIQRLKPEEQDTSDSSKSHEPPAGDASDKSDGSAKSDELSKSDANR
jgi:hypothetical protein